MTLSVVFACILTTSAFSWMQNRFLCLFLLSQLDSKGPPVGDKHWPHQHDFLISYLNRQARRTWRYILRLVVVSASWPSMQIVLVRWFGDVNRWRRWSWRCRRKTIEKRKSKLTAQETSTSLGPLWCIWGSYWNLTAIVFVPFSLVS